MAAAKRRIMRTLKIVELAGVDRPAQAPAKVLLMKRDEEVVETGNSEAPQQAIVDFTKRLLQPKKGESRDDYVARFMSSETAKKEFPEQEQRLAVAFEQFRSKSKKSMYLTDSVNGHSHLLDLSDASRQGGRTSYEKSENAEYGHDHPFVINAEGRVTIGDAEGHGHVLVATKVLVDETEHACKQLARLHEDGLLNLDSKESETQMTATIEKAEDAATTAKIAKLEADLRLAKALGEMSDAQKAHYAGLEDAGKAAFVAKSAHDRQAEVTKAAEADPVVYTDTEGNAYRKSDDPRTVALAKRADEAIRSAAASAEREATATFTKRAESELTHMPGELDAKVALLRKVGEIKDEGLRGKVESMLKANCEKLAKAFERVGTSKAGTEGGPEAQLEALAKKHATDNKVDLAKARVDVLSTPEGAALYEQTIKAKVA